MRWISAAFLSLTLGCFTDSGAQTCQRGSAGCPCDGQSCDAGLECNDDNYCLDPNCVEGRVDCPCYGNGTCDPGLECSDGQFCKPGSSEATSSPPATSTQGSTSSMTDGVTNTTAGPTTTTSTSTTTEGSTSGAGCDCATGHCTPEGACARYVFVTQAAYPSNFGGLDAGDGICAAEADKLGLDGNFVVYVRTDGSEAFSHARIDMIPDAVFILPGEPLRIVASSPDPLMVDPADSMNEMLEAPIDRDADGNQLMQGETTACSGVVSQRVWTGLRGLAVGGSAMAGPNCEGWTGGSNGSTGRFDVTGRGWIAGANCECDTVSPFGDTVPATAHLYCVEVP